MSSGKCLWVLSRTWNTQTSFQIIRRKYPTGKRKRTHQPICGYGSHVVVGQIFLQKVSFQQRLDSVVVCAFISGPRKQSSKYVIEYMLDIESTVLFCNRKLTLNSFGKWSCSIGISNTFEPNKLKFENVFYLCYFKFIALNAIFNKISGFSIY